MQHAKCWAVCYADRIRHQQQIHLLFMMFTESYLTNGNLGYSIFVFKKGHKRNDNETKRKEKTRRQIENNTRRALTHRVNTKLNR